MSQFRRKRGFLLALGVAALCSSGAAFAQPVPDPIHKENDFPRVWGALWYLRSTSEQDTVSGVVGGVDGSSTIVMRSASQRRSDWFFLEGSQMTIRLLATDPNPVFTTTPGLMIRSRNTLTGSEIEAPVAGNARLLSYALADAFFLSKRDHAADLQKSVVRHVPFFVGSGWPSGGATIDEALSLCASTNLVLDYPAGTPGNTVIAGHVIPPAGAEVGGTALAIVRVNVTSQTPTPALLPGSSPDFPKPIGASNVPVDATMTTMHRDRVAWWPDPVGCSEIYYKLPTTIAANTRVQATMRHDVGPTALSAWTRATPTSSLTLLVDPSGFVEADWDVEAPLIDFSMPSTECFIVVEFPARNVGDAKLVATWPITSAH